MHENLSANQTSVLLNLNEIAKKSVSFGQSKASWLVEISRATVGTLRMRIVIQTPSSFRFVHRNRGSEDDWTRRPCEWDGDASAGSSGQGTQPLPRHLQRQTHRPSGRQEFWIPKHRQQKDHEFD